MSDRQLDRREAVPALLGDSRDLLLVAGLGGAARELSAITGDAPNLFALGGAMGAAVPLALGLALARPERRVLVATGDGELLMNVSTLATVAVMAPPNLAILCVDNGHYGETGYQKGHTERGIDLEVMGRGAGFKSTLTVSSEAGLGPGRELLYEAPGPVLVVLRVKPTDPLTGPLTLDPVAQITRFRAVVDRLLAEAR